jgi:CHAT domain-containing protein
VRADSLAARVRFARALLADRSASERAKPALVRLHAELIAPVVATRALSGIRTIIIVPHGMLAYLPFAALVDATSKRYLVQDFSVLVAPTAATLPALRRIAAGAPRPARALATTVLAPFAKQLPGSRDEVRRIADARAHTKSFVGAAATERRLRASLETGGTLHIATHAVMNARNPLFSRIEFAAGQSRESSDDGRLEVYEILRLRFTAPLVFLSGCETAVGGSWSTQFDNSEDFTTMAQAWLYAGARNVVATLWRIDDLAAAEFSQRFYRAMRGGSVADALAEAQRAMISDPKLKSPYLWASYQLLGDGRGEEIPRPEAKSMSLSVQR